MYVTPVWPPPTPTPTTTLALHFCFILSSFFSLYESVTGSNPIYIKMRLSNTDIFRFAIIIRRCTESLWDPTTEKYLTLLDQKY